MRRLSDLSFCAICVFFLITCYPTTYLSAQNYQGDFLSNVYQRAYNLYLDGEYKKSLDYLISNSFVTRDKSGKMLFVEILNLHGLHKDSSFYAKQLESEIERYYRSVLPSGFNMIQYANVMNIELELKIFKRIDAQKFKDLTGELNIKDSTNLKHRILLTDLYLTNTKSSFFTKQLDSSKTFYNSKLNEIRVKRRDSILAFNRKNKLKDLGSFSLMELGYSITNSSNYITAISNQTELIQFLELQKSDVYGSITPNRIYSVSLVNIGASFPQTRSYKLSFLWSLIDWRLFEYSNTNNDFLFRKKSAIDLASVDKMYVSYLGMRFGLMHTNIIRNKIGLSFYWQIIPAVNFLNSNYQYQITDENGMVTQRQVVTENYPLGISNEFGLRCYFTRRIYIGLTYRITDSSMENVVKEYDVTIRTIQSSSTTHQFGLVFGI